MNEFNVFNSQITSFYISMLSNLEMLKKERHRLKLLINHFNKLQLMTNTDYTNDIKINIDWLNEINFEIKKTSVTITRLKNIIEKYDIKLD